MKNNDALKKHHFWLLLGVVPLLTMIGVLLVDSNVGGKIEDRKKAIDAANSKIAQKLDAKPESLIKDGQKLVDKVSKKQGGLHKDNWERQKNLFTWPAGSPKLLKSIETGEYNVERYADQILDRIIKRAKDTQPEYAAKLTKERAELDKMSSADVEAKLKVLLKTDTVRPDLNKPEERPARLKAILVAEMMVRPELGQLPFADRKAVLEPAWPKFGDPLPTANGEFDEFKKPEVYIYEYSSLKKDGTYGPVPGMADKVAPTQFKGGWQSVLRHVTDWGQGNITNDQVWLIMEDIWVQRSLLDGIRSINAETAAFSRGRLEKDGNVSFDPTFDDDGYKVAWREVKDKEGKPVVKDGKPVLVADRIPTPPDQKTDTLFRNRTWAVNLKLAKDSSGQQRLKGTLTNLTDRLQLLGVGDMMTLKVWFTHNTTEQPTTFRIGGSYLRGRGATRKENGVDVPDNSKEILELEEHLLPVSNNATEIVRVEQVFDVRTVPVKRIDALVLGQPDSRLGDKIVLAPPAPDEKSGAFKPEAVVTTDPMGMGPMGMGGSAGGPPPSAGGPPSMGGFGGTTTGTKFGGGAITAVIDGNKRRYLPDGVTAQVRRMPVGIVVVVDQVYIQDVLLAFANSPLRFQITQVTWTRFRGELAGISGTGGTGGPSGDVNYGKGNNYIPSGDPDAPGGGRPIPGPAGVGSSGGPPPSSVGGPPPSSVGGPRPMGPMGPFGMGPLGMGPSSPGGPSQIASESQITSGLVELSVYGIVSLYEKFTEPGTTPAAPATTATPAAPGTPAVPGQNQPMPMNPMPMNPMPMNPKMRRRIRK